MVKLQRVEKRGMGGDASAVLRRCASYSANHMHAKVQQRIFTQKRLTYFNFCTRTHHR